MNPESNYSMDFCEQPDDGEIAEIVRLEILNTDPAHYPNSILFNSIQQIARPMIEQEKNRTDYSAPIITNIADPTPDSDTIHKKNLDLSDLYVNISEMRDSVNNFSLEKQ